MFHYLKSVPTCNAEFRDKERNYKQNHQNMHNMPILKAESVFGIETRRHASVTAFSLNQPIVPGFTNSALKTDIPLSARPSNNEDKTQLDEVVRYMHPKPIFRPLQFNIPDFQVGVETRTKTLL